MKMAMLVVIVLALMIGFWLPLFSQELPVAAEITEAVSMYQANPSPQPIAPEESPDPDEIVIEMVNINHLAASQVANFLSKHPASQYLTVDDKLNSICITAPRHLIESVKALICQIDVKMPQIQLEASVVDTSKGLQNDRISQWRGDFGPKDVNGLWSIEFANSIFRFSDTRTGEKLALFALLDSQDQLKTLAQPKLVVKNGETAEIYIGRDTWIPIVVTPIYGTQSTPSEMKPIQAGIRLRFTPRVIENEEIQLVLEQEVSDIATTLGTGIPIVVINKRLAKSILEVKDGETVMIGGLASSSESYSKNSVPILSDLPLIGNLFTSSRKRTDKQEVTILVTPKIIVPEVTEQVIEKAKQKIEERKPGL